LVVVVFWDRVSLCMPVRTGAYYVAQAGLEFEIFLPQPPEYWDYSHATPSLTFTESFS
jgi:hypothetical protein